MAATKARLLNHDFPVHGHPSFSDFFYADFGKEFPSRTLWRGPLPFALQNRALFEAEKRAKRCREKGRKRGGQQRERKGKKDA